MSRFIPYASNTESYIVDESLTPSVAGEAEKKGLDHIIVGCLNLVDNELNRALNFARGNIPKLERQPNGSTNYYLWLRYVEAGLRMWQKNRALGFLKGTVEGSISAYRRYFGRPFDGGNTVPELASVQEAVALFENDDVDVGSFLMATISPTMVSALMDRASVDTGSGRSLWRALQDKCVPTGTAAKRIVGQMLATYQPSSPNAETIINELGQLFHHWTTTSGEQLDESEKVMYLMQHLPSGFQPLKAVLHDYVETNGISFDDAARRAIDDERMRVMSATMQAMRPAGAPGQTKPAPQYPNPAQDFVLNPNQQQQLIGYSTTAFPNPFGGAPASPTQSMASSSGSWSNLSSASSASSAGRPPRDPSTITCYHCGDKGHESRNCAKRLAGEPKTYVPTHKRLAAQQQQQQRTQGQAARAAEQEQEANHVTHYSMAATHVASYPQWIEGDAEQATALSEYLH